MGPVTIEESDDEKSIVTPELRVRFRRTEDRWVHSIEVPGDPWLALAESVEWHGASESPGTVLSPTYQEIHFQRDGDAVMALLVGAAGPHHFSASIRASWKVHRSPEPYNGGFEYPGTRVVFDLADRCRLDPVEFEAHYLIHDPPIDLHLGNDREVDADGELKTDWRPRLDWTVRREDSYQAQLSGVPGRRGKTAIAYVERPSAGRWRIRIAAPEDRDGNTRRMQYAWSHLVRRPITG